MLAKAMVIALVVLASTTRTAADEYALFLLGDWIKAVRAHVPGTLDPPLISISKWNRDDLLRLQPFVRGLVDSVPDTRRLRAPRIQLSNADAAEVRLLAKTAAGGLGANELAKRGALLHTDVVLLVQTDPSLVPAPRPRQRQSLLEREEQVPLVIARGPDGRFDGFELGNLNWDYARDLLDAVTPLPAADATVALWYRSISAHFASTYSFGEAWPHIERARRLLPDDPGNLFADAAVQETLASPSIQDYVRVTKLPNGQGFLFVTSAKAHLEKAEELFRKTVQQDPAFVEARLRLGRVLSQLGRHAEALKELQAVLPVLPDPALTFYAHLIIGDAERTLARYGAARQSYQKALELFPNAQSARMALSHLARLASDREGALALLQPTLAASPLGRGEDDPWWDYHLGDGRRVVDLLRQLRAPFVEGSPQ